MRRRSTVCHSAGEESDRLCECGTGLERGGAVREVVGLCEPDRTRETTRTSPRPTPGGSCHPLRAQTQTTKKSSPRWFIIERVKMVEGVSQLPGGGLVRPIITPSRQSSPRSSCRACRHVQHSQRVSGKRCI